METNNICVGIIRKRVEVVLKAVITVLAFSLNYSLVNNSIAEQNYLNIYSIFPTVSKLFLSIDEFTLSSLIIFAFLIKFYNVVSDMDIGRDRRGTCVFLSIVASFSLLIGNAFYRYGDVEVLSQGTIQILKSCFIWFGYFLFFYYLWMYIMQKYNEYLQNIKERKIAFFEKKHTFLVIVVIFLVAWFPVFLAYYPAMFMGDSEDIIYMAFNYPTGIINTVQLRVEGVNMTNHHPVIFTVIVGTVLKLVRAFGGSDNMGIFVYALMQYVVSAFVLAYTCVYCGRDLKKYHLAIGSMLFYIFCPWIPKYVIMISKDTIFAECILLLGIQLHKAVREKCEKKQILMISLLAVAILLFRKNGFYVVFLTFILLLFLYRKQWKKWLLCLAVLLACNTLYSDVILPVCGITEGSVREALSIPFQQTARYVKEHGEEVTQAEKQAIDAVLRYDELAELYDGNISDPVKATFRIDSDSEDLKNYFVVWFQMLWKHPETYIAATLNNYYGYVYPVVNDVHKLYRTSVGSMSNANRDGYFHFGNRYDGVSTWLRDMFAFVDLLWMKMPILNLFTMSAFYVWTVIVGMVLKIIRKENTGLIVMFMYLALILTAIAGPCNAIDYERYISPCILAFPFIVGIMLQEDRVEEDDRNGRNLSISTDTVL